MHAHGGVLGLERLDVAVDVAFADHSLHLDISTMRIRSSSLTVCNDNLVVGRRLRLPWFRRCQGVAGLTTVGLRVLEVFAVGGR
jgi:hypothetical protein